MSEMIDMSNGRANMAYIGQKPWHGLGIDMPEDASLDQWRVEAGLNWEAVRGEALVRTNTGLVSTGDQFLYRSDNQTVLGHVTKRYKVVQPEQVVEFYRDLCEEYDFRMETLGALDDGKRVWALAKSGEYFRLKGQDQVDSYVLLATSYDGKMATRAMFTSVRVVCHNTLSMAMAGQDGVSIGHRSEFNSDSVKAQMGLRGETFKVFQQHADNMSEVGVNKAAAVQFLTQILAGEDAKVEKLSTRQGNIVQNVLNLFEGKGMGADYSSSKGTVWGLVNSVTEYVDHQYGRNQNNRLRAAWFGKGNDMKNKAFDKALTLVQQAA